MELASWKPYPEKSCLPQELWLKNRKTKKIEYGIKQVQNIYLQHGFKIKRIHADSEFEPLHAEMADLGIYLNSKSKKENFTEIDQFNRNVKERVQASQSAMTFKRISKLMIFQLVVSDIFWLNDFPPSKPGAGL